MVSFPSSLVPSLHALVFIQKTFFVTCSCDLFMLVLLLLLLLYRNGKREGEDVWSIKFDNVHIQLRIIIKLPVNPNITLFFYLYGGLEAQAKPHKSVVQSTWVLWGFISPAHFVWATIGFTKKFSVD